jgi:hypothetical protein
MSERPGGKKQGNDLPEISDKADQSRVPFVYNFGKGCTSRGHENLSGVKKGKCYTDRFYINHTTS